MMLDHESLAQLTKKLIDDEDISLKPYFCPGGKLTIGVGRNLESNGISRSEAMLLLYNDIARVDGELAANVPFLTQLSQARQLVLFNMCFALGLPRFLGFKKMLAALGAGDYPLAAEELLDSKWSREVGHRAVNLAEQLRRG
jgi:lysozyme